jgi:hypothetical protein
MFLSALATIAASMDQGKLLKGGSAMSEENKAVVRRFSSSITRLGHHQTWEASNSPFSC